MASVLNEGRVDGRTEVRTDERIPAPERPTAPAVVPRAPAAPAARQTAGTPATSRPPPGLPQARSAPASPQRAPQAPRARAHGYPLDARPDPLPAAATAFPDQATALLNTLDRPVVGGNRVDLLVERSDIAAALGAAIGAARDHVHLELCRLDGDPDHGALVEQLLAARARGVPVSVMVDGISSLRTPDALLARLRNAGVALCKYNPLGVWHHPLRRALHLRDHRKLAIVDGRVGFVGGVEVGLAGTGEAPVVAERVASGESRPVRPAAAPPVRDLHARIEGPVVAQLQQAFVQLWVAETGRQPSAAHHFPGLRSVGTQRVGVAVGEAGGRRNPYYRALRAAIDLAKHRVWLTTAHFVPPRGLLESLLAACRRGVDVRLLAPGESESWAPLAAARANYAALLRAGAHLFELTGVALQSRTALIDDDWVAIGSSTLDWGSVLHNAEITVIVLDGALAAQLEVAYRADIARARPITLEQWAARGTLPRLQEWTARRLEPFL